jgi:hypothetical protein
MQINIARNIDILAVNKITDDQMVQKMLFLKSIWCLSLSKEATRGKLDEIVRKSTAVIAR